MSSRDDNKILFATRNTLDFYLQRTCFVQRNDNLFVSVLK